MKPLSSLLLLWFFTISAFAQGDDLLDAKTRDLLLKALSGEQAKQHVVEISKYHRVQASRQYHLAAQYVLEKLRSYGFSKEDAYIESFPSDGKIAYQTWQSPSGWDITGGVLSVVEPVQDTLQRFSDIPMSVMTYSNPGDVTAEVVDVGAGTADADYKGKSVKGKFVLATGYGGDVHRLAVLKYGAKAVVCYLDDERSREHPDLVQYTGIWPRPEELAKVTFGFNISRRQGERLKAMLQEGKKVTLHGVVQGVGLEPGALEVVVAHIRGALPVPKELLFSAHLDHPKFSANDNASGSAAILDIARAFRSLIDSNKLPQPGFSFRFLWVPEWNGTMAYIDKHPELVGPDLGGRCFANINMDMVGENTELLHSKLAITQTPFSIASCLNSVVANMAQMVDRLDIFEPSGSNSAFNYRVIPYVGGSDHMMFIDRKIPGVMFSHWPDYTHHTSDDTPDKVDPTELKRSEMIAASTMWFLGAMGEEQALDLIEVIRADASRQLVEMGRVTRKHLLASKTADLPVAWGEADNMLVPIIVRCITNATSVPYFQNAPNVDRVANLMQPHLSMRFQYLFDQMKATCEANGYAADGPDPVDPNPDTLIPVRLTRGPLDFRLPQSKLPPKEAEWYSSKNFPLTGDMKFEVVNYIDGKRTVTDIRNAVMAEFTKVSSADVGRYIRDLIKAGVLKKK